MNTESEKSNSEVLPDKHQPDEHQQVDAPDANRDPITGEPGAHPIGTGVGAVVAGTVGTALGALGGPVGGVVGAAVGAAVGGLLGKSAAEAFDPTAEEEYWRDNYASRPYVKPDLSYDDYLPAYRSGYEGYSSYSTTGKRYDEIEPDLRRDYETNYRDSKVTWDDAKHAAEDAWKRAEEYKA
jgi:hypothetical protein